MIPLIPSLYNLQRVPKPDLTFSERSSYKNLPQFWNRFLYKIQFILLSGYFLFSCENMGTDQVRGKEAIQEIQKEILNISIYELLGRPRTNSSSSCGSASIESAITELELNDQFASAQTLSPLSNSNPSFQISGSISGNTDVDVFRFFSLFIGTAQFKLVSGSALCRISFGVDESGNLSAFPTGPNSILPLGASEFHTVGPSPIESVYVDCQGLAGQDYQISVGLPNETPSVYSGLSSGQDFLASLGSPDYFTAALGIEESKSYTRHSLNRCLNAIRTTGHFIAIEKYNVSNVSCGSQRLTYEVGRILLLKSDCTLEQTKGDWNKIYGTGQ
ncbi:hypothetical protein JWG44_19520 [Leptospira sp. 201903071]|uniref:hypothetical protein n=1 Tax=Leptospira ainazelensis TaxID=2810034 RepID=UPI001963FDCE|nr:hypothetical protein [Leptospira ainazelensis]MBM9502446.1 hypothetical protein [Leptospira ainazelensis]